MDEDIFIISTVDKPIKVVFEGEPIDEDEAVLRFLELLQENINEN